MRRTVPEGCGHRLQAAHLQENYSLQEGHLHHHRPHQLGHHRPRHHPLLLLLLAPHLLLGLPPLPHPLLLFLLRPHLLDGRSVLLGRVLWMV